MRECLVVLVALVAAAWGEMQCGPLQQIKVKHQWQEVYGTGHDRVDMGVHIFQILFDGHPKMPEELFTGVRGDNVGSDEFAAHVLRVLGGLDIAIGLLEEKEVLDVYLAGLHEFHQKTNVPDAYFEAFFHALGRVVPEKVPNFDQDAWHACYEVIRKGIVKA